MEKIRLADVRHVMQNSAEEEMKNWTMISCLQLESTSCTRCTITTSQLHKLYHRSDDGGRYTKGQVRTFYSISQSAGVAKKTYVPSNFRLSAGGCHRLDCVQQGSATRVCVS